MNTYIHYLTHPEQHTNTAATHAGMGDTREEAIANSRYYANQGPWTRTVPISRAPRWAVEEAEEASMNTNDTIQNLLYDAEVEARDGLEHYDPERGAYRVRPCGPWDDTSVHGVSEDSDGIWADGDAVDESVQIARVEALIEAGYSTGQAHSQRYGYDLAALAHASGVEQII